MSSQGPFAFADGKDPGAFRTIGEVAQAFGLRQHVLRYWEEQFPMLKPLKRSGGRRYYRPEDVQLVSEISRLLYREGFTIRGARQALKAQDAEASVGGSAEATSIIPEPTSVLAEPERPGEELKRPESSIYPVDSASELGRKLQRVRDALGEALHEA